MTYKIYYVVHQKPTVQLNVEPYDNVFIYGFIWSHD